MSPSRIAVLAAALALAAAMAAVALGRDAAPADSPLASLDNPGPRGAAALGEWLAAGGRAPERAPPYRRGTVPVVAAPPAPLSAAEAGALLAHARAGGLAIWAAGPAGSQPELERRLAVRRVRGEPGGDAAALAPHPLLDGLTLPASGASVASDAPGALPVAGGAGFAAAVSVPVGRGEVLVLAGPDLLENRRIGSGDALAFWARVAERGAPAFDEGHWTAPSPPRPAARRALWLLAAQALAAALALFWARGRRLGAVRPPPPAVASRTAADYLEALGALYRRARAEGDLAAAAWRAHRLRLQRRAGIPVRLPDEEVAARLEPLSPAAAEAFRDAASAAARGAASPGDLLALVRALARTEERLDRRGPSAGSGGRRAW